VENIAVIYSPQRDFSLFNFQNNSRHNYILQDGTKSFYQFENKVVNHSEKPLDLLQQLIETHSHPSELILDLFSGSGSAICAGLLAGRNVLSLEIDSFQTIAISARVLKLGNLSLEASQADEISCTICKKGPASELLVCTNECGHFGHWRCNVMLNHPDMEEDEAENTFFCSENCWNVARK
jgi:hypothetical protein